MKHRLELLGEMKQRGKNEALAENYLRHKAVLKIMKARQWERRKAQIAGVCFVLSVLVVLGAVVINAM